MSTAKHPHEWSADALLDKAQRYAKVMLKQDRTDWQFGFWSALTLEMIARAALAKVSPTLIADGKDWNNTYYALGKTPITSRFVPKSIDIAEVFRRVHAIFPEDFNVEMHNFCSQHINLRNTEVHSGALPFDSLGTSVWLPSFYSVCQSLLKLLGEDLGIILGPGEEELADGLIKSLEDKAAKAVEGTITTHREAWESKKPGEKKALSKRADVLSARHIGHRVKCPSCGNTSLVHGSPFGAPTKTLEDDVIVERQSMLPSHFECFACGLKISGYSKLNACGLGDAFTATSRFDAFEYYEPPDKTDDGYYFEEDFNE